MGVLEIGGISVIVAFVAGLLSIASPCILPLIPAYLGYLTGVSLEGEDAMAPTPQTAQGAVVASTSAHGGPGVAAMALPDGGRMRAPTVATPSPFLHAVSFVGGFSLVFILFGISLGIVGFFLRDQQDIIFKVAGGSLIILGLHLGGG